MLRKAGSKITHKGLKVKKNHLDEHKDEVTTADPARDWDQGPAQSPARSSPAQGWVSAAPCSHKASSVSLGRAEAAAASPGTTGKQTPGLSRGWEFVFLNITQHCKNASSGQDQHQGSSQALLPAACLWQ